MKTNYIIKMYEKTKFSSVFYIIFFLLININFLFAVQCPIFESGAPFYADSCDSCWWASACDITIYTDCGCNACLPGFRYNSILNAYSNYTNTCVPCSINTYSAGGTGISCTACSTGCNTDNQTGQDACRNASAGYYFDSNNTCFTCPNGTYTDTTNTLSACTPCPIGKYNTGIGNTSCNTNCTNTAIGKYFTASGNASGNCPIANCTNSKPLNSHYNTFGGDTNNCGWECDTGFDLIGTICQKEVPNCLNFNGTGYCDYCDAGYKIENSGTINAICVSCPVNTFSTSGSTSCTSCSTGCNTAGKTAENSCYYSDAGYFYNSPNSCSYCPDGYFNSNIIRYVIGQQQSVDDAGNPLTDSTGAPIMEDKYDYRYNYNQATSCSACPINTYSVGAPVIADVQDTFNGGRNTNKIACIDCILPSSTGILTGQSSCDYCAEGYFLQSANTCIECGVGTYMNVPNQLSSCYSCPAGTYMDSQGATICLVCQEGSISGTDPSIPNVTGATSCIECPIGEYTADNDHLSCHSCPIGTYGDAVGLSSCEVCQTGFYNPITGQDSCIPKQVLHCTTYSPDVDLQKCTACEAGWELAGSGDTSYCRQTVPDCDDWTGTSLTEDNWCSHCSIPKSLQSAQTSIAFCSDVIPNCLLYYPTGTSFPSNSCQTCENGYTLDNNPITNPAYCVEHTSCIATGGQAIPNTMYGCSCIGAGRTTLEDRDTNTARCVKKIDYCTHYTTGGYCDTCDINNGSLIDGSMINAECKTITNCQEYEPTGGLCHICLFPYTLTLGGNPVPSNGATCEFNATLTDKCNKRAGLPDTTNDCINCNYGSFNNFASPIPTMPDAPDRCTLINSCHEYNNSYNGACASGTGLVCDDYTGYDTAKNGTCKTCINSYIGNNQIDDPTPSSNFTEPDTGIHTKCYREVSTPHGTCNEWSRRNGYCIACSVGSLVNKGQVNADCWEIKNCTEYEPEGGSCHRCSARFVLEVATDTSRDPVLGAQQRMYCKKEVKNCNAWLNILHDKDNDCTSCDTANGWEIQNDPNGRYGSWSNNPARENYCVKKAENCVRYDHNWSQDNYCSECDTDWSVVNPEKPKANCRKDIDNCNQWFDFIDKNNFCIRCDNGFHLTDADEIERRPGKDGILDTDTDGDKILDADNWILDYKQCYADIKNCRQHDITGKESCKVCNGGYYRVDENNHYLGIADGDIDNNLGNRNATSCIINVINPQMKSISTSLLTNTIIINQLADLISTKGVENAIIALSSDQDTNVLENELTRVALFGAGSGGYSQYNVGGIIDTISYNSIVGVAYYNLFVQKSVFGIFMTMGGASYSINNEAKDDELEGYSVAKDLGNFNLLKEETTGKGTNKYYGGGLLFRLPYWSNMLYSDFSIYGGIIENKFTLDKPIYLTIEDFLNKNINHPIVGDDATVKGFNMKTEFMGGSIGQGFIYKTDEGSFEVYAKYLVSVVRGKEICIENCDDDDKTNDVLLILDDTISSRAKLGIKYKTNLIAQVTENKNCIRNPAKCNGDNYILDLYIGINTDYEMLGNSVVKVKDYQKFNLAEANSQIEPASLKGFTTEVELGLNNKISNNLSFDIAGSVFTGVRIGYMGNASIKYRFGSSKAREERQEKVKTKIQMEERRLKELEEKCGEYEVFNLQTEKCDIAPENYYIEEEEIEYDRNKRINPEETLERGYIPKGRRKK